jgi:hypothetical protein
MALSFLSSSDQTLDVVATCDSSVTADEAQRSAYLESGDLKQLGKVGKDATQFTLKALSPAEREEAEARAGALTRSELGRLLWTEAPTDTMERAQWHHKLSDDEREAMSDYQAYLNRVYKEMINASLTHIDGAEASADQLELIRPEAHRIQTVSELVLHIQRISLLGLEGK